MHRKAGIGTPSIAFRFPSFGIRWRIKRGAGTLQKRFRLTKEAQFKKLRGHGRSWANPLLVLYALPNEAGTTRVGISVSKRVGKAVTRNRARRLVREAFRLRLDVVRQGWDLLFIARQPIAMASFQMVSSAVEQLLRRAGLLERLPGDTGQRVAKDLGARTEPASKELLDESIGS